MVKVWLAVRTPPTIIFREDPGGLPGDWIGTAMLHFPTRFGNASARFGSRQDFGDLSERGLPVPEEGLMTRLRRDRTALSIVDKEVIEAVKQGTVEIIAAVELRVRHGRPPAIVQDTEVADQRLEGSAVAGGADDRVGLGTASAGEVDPRGVERLEYLENRHEFQEQAHLRTFIFDDLWSSAVFTRQWALRARAEIERWRDLTPTPAKHRRALKRIRSLTNDASSLNPAPIATATSQEPALKRRSRPH